MVVVAEVVILYMAVGRRAGGVVPVQTDQAAPPVSVVFRVADALARERPHGPSARGECVDRENQKRYVPSQFHFCLFRYNFIVNIFR